MDDQKQIEDRWRELDELLGLSTPAAPPPTKIEKPAAPPEPSVRHEEGRRAHPEHQSRMEEEELPSTFREEPEAPAEPMAEWESEFEEDADTEVMEPQELADLEGQASEAESPEGAPSAGEDEEQPRRGRRRRRRGRRRGGPDKGEPEGAASGQAPATEMPRDEKGPPPRPARDTERDSRERRPQGRRGNRRDEDERRRPRPVEPIRQESESAPMDDFEDEPAAVARVPITEDDTDFSDWDVPAWQDLIASLYRPDR